MGPGLETLTSCETVELENLIGLVLRPRHPLPSPFAYWGASLIQVLIALLGVAFSNPQLQGTHCKSQPLWTDLVFSINFQH